MSASKWKPYSEYKTARLDWLGEIPTHWKTGRLKNILRLSTEKNGATPVGDMLSVSGYRGIETKIYDHEDQQRTDEDLKDYRVVRKGQLVVNTMWLNHSGLGVSDLEGHVSPAYRTYNIDENYYGKFLHHLVRSSTYVGHYCSLLYGIRPNSYQVKNHDWDSVELLIPPIQEQKDIAEFLDSFTEKIDDLIHELEQEKMLLEEKRSSLITQAVTKGLNLDVPMKDSGIDWYGEIPEHWSLLKMNYVVNEITDIDHYMPKSVDEGVPYLMTGDLEDRVSEINFQNCKQVSDLDFQNLSRKVRTSKGDVILARYATIGTASYVDIERDFLVSYSCVTVKPNVAKVTGLFMYYFFKSDAFKGGAQYYTNTGTQGNVGVGDLKKIKMILPTLEEQSKIVKYLNLHVSLLDKVSDSVKKKILMLNEYRTSIISAAVTGKIDVRESV